VAELSKPWHICHEIEASLGFLAKHQYWKKFQKTLNCPEEWNIKVNTSYIYFGDFRPESAF